MTFYTDLFTPETWAAFVAHGKSVSEFRERQRRTAERINPGDVFVCYVVRLSRWCGLLRITSAMYVDGSPIFSNPDPFVLRFKVEPIVALDLEQAIPIFDDGIWLNLSLTRDLGKRSFGWAQSANLRSSLRELSDDDGKLLSTLLTRQGHDRRAYPFSASDSRRLTERKSIQSGERAVVVEVPEAPAVHVPEDAEEENGPPASEPRESHRMQALLARIRIDMGFRVWTPRADKQRVRDQLSEKLCASLIDILSLSYDDTTLKAIEQIDVIWLKGRSMARAFEVEHTTAIYSGLLRMADLLALQPNMQIPLHILALAEKQEKVLREIRRPVFSPLDRGPLYESCTYLPYESVEEIASMELLSHMNASIVDAESAEDD